MNLRTIYDPPPIPERQFDWQCYDSSTYNGAEDAGPIAHCLGFGLTEADAIANWRELWAVLHKCDDWPTYEMQEARGAFVRLKTPKDWHEPKFQKDKA